MGDLQAGGSGGRTLRTEAGALLASRIVEQATYGLGALLLAARLGVDGFVPISVLLVVNSFAITASDVGVGLAVLRLPEGARLARGSLRRLRLGNLGIAAVAGAAGVLVGGRDGAVVALSGLLWLTSAEAFVAKSALVRLHRASRSAAVEVAGTAVLAAGLALAAVEVDHAHLIAGGALVLKHVVEAALAGPWARDLVGDAVGPADELRLLWLAQVVSYATANVDFLIVGQVFGGRAFAVYVLAFRLSNTLPSQVAHVVGRLSMVDFGTASAVDEWQRAYDRYVGRLLRLGFVGVLVTAAGAPVVTWLLGDEWRSLGWIVVVLAVAVPWRMVLPVAAAAILSSRHTATSVRWELLRLGAAVAGLGIAAAIGLPVVAAVSVALAAGGALAYHWGAARRLGFVPPRHLALAAVASVVVAAGLATQITVPG